MPNLDKTGPMGKGPMTGRKMGRCSEISLMSNLHQEETAIEEVWGGSDAVVAEEQECSADFVEENNRIDL